MEWLGAVSSVHLSDLEDVLQQALALVYWAGENRPEKSPYSAGHIILLAAAFKRCTMGEHNGGFDRTVYLFQVRCTLYFDPAENPEPSPRSTGLSTHGQCCGA